MPIYRRVPNRGFTNARFKTDYTIVNVEAFEAFEGVLSDAGYNILEIDETDERLALLTSLDVEEAGERVEAYNETECGLGGDDEDDDVEGTEE